MEISTKLVVFSLVLITVITWLRRAVNWVWLRPKRLEKYLRHQGLAGNSYRFLSGDLKEISFMAKEANSTPIPLTNDIPPRVFPFLHKVVSVYGKNSFVWNGPIPKVTVMDPDLIKDVLTKMYEFRKPHFNPLVTHLASGLANYDGEKWTKHRKIINSAFQIEKLKKMLPAFYESCNEIIHEWDELVLKEGSCELDIWPYLITLTRDVISRTAFGSSYKEGRRIFQLQRELADIIIQVLQSVYIPGWRYIK